MLSPLLRVYHVGATSDVFWTLSGWPAPIWSVEKGTSAELYSHRIEGRSSRLSVLTGARWGYEPCGIEMLKAQTIPSHRSTKKGFVVASSSSSEDESVLELHGVSAIQGRELATRRHFLEKANVLSTRALYSSVAAA